MDLRGLRQKFVLSLILGLAVVLGLFVYGSGPALLQVLGGFEWTLLPAILGLTLLNYVLRFVKWNYYLDQIDAQVPFSDSLAIFTAGLSMAVTPGKVGEVLKPVLLRLRGGTPISRTIPVIVAERLTDGIAMILLAVAGLLLSGAAWQILLLSLVLAAVVIALLGSTPGGALMLRLGERMPLIGPRLALLENFLQSSRRLFTPVNLALAIGIGVLSWGGEALAFYLVLVGLGITPSITLLIDATFVLATSTLVGSLSMLPGGLGAADASVAGLLSLVVHVGRAKAAAATLLIRICTLWFGVSLGVVALFVFRHRFALAVLESDTAAEPLAISGSQARAR